MSFDMARVRTRHAGKGRPWAKRPGASSWWNVVERYLGGGRTSDHQGTAIAALNWARSHALLPQDYILGWGPFLFLGRGR